jgi:predicted permease
MLVSQFGVPVMTALFPAKFVSYVLIFSVVGNVFLKPVLHVLLLIGAQRAQAAEAFETRDDRCPLGACPLRG